MASYRVMMKRQRASARTQRENGLKKKRNGDGERGRQQVGWESAVPCVSDGSNDDGDGRV